MEVHLEVMVIKDHIEHNNRFNPYFYGSTFRSGKRSARRKLRTCFNPYFYGSTFRRRKGIICNRRTIVGFNPYFYGSTFRR